MTRSLPLGLLALVASTFLPSHAEACGGFFCANVPMDQSKERIVFAVDEEEEKVDVHIQIFFEGEAHDFAWIVPVPGVPEVGLSTDQLFQTLTWQTQPRFWVDMDFLGECDFSQGGGWYGPATDDFAEADADGGGGVGGGQGVDVLASGQTGAFDWTVVSAESQEQLVAWLDDPDGDGDDSDAYALPDNLGPVLGAYLADGNNFIAVRLTSDATTGEITPLRMTYDGTEASIPLILTSIAATPDMRLEPYVFTQGKRAVPSNYLHVRINEAKINWLDGGSNYDDVITQAANEAGGQAFATDYFGKTDGLRGQLWSEGRYDTEALRGLTDPAAFVQRMLSDGWPRSGTVQALLLKHVPMPSAAVEAGVDVASFYNSLEYYLDEYPLEAPFEPGPFADDLETLVAEPLEDAETLLQTYSHVTRMTSSMSPLEMTKDPIFALNPDMSSEVSNQHNATLWVDCRQEKAAHLAPRWLEIPDGRRVEVPNEQWFWDHPQSWTDWNSTAADQPAAEVIEKTSASGQPVPVSDVGDDVDRLVEEHNDWVASLDGRTPAVGDDELTVGGCAQGCSQSGVGGAASLLGLVGLLSLRRRRD